MSLLPYVLRISNYTTTNASRGDNGSARPPLGYAFMPAVGPSVHAGYQRVHAGVHAVCAFMQYVNVFMQAASSLRPPGVVQYALY